MIVRTALLLSVCGAILLAACDSGSTGPSQNPKASLLVDKNWKRIADVVAPGYDDGTGNIITDQYAVNGDCANDDLTRFTSDGKWTIDAGPSKCGLFDPQIEHGTWTLNTAATSLTMISELDSVPLTFILEEVTAASLKVSRTTSDYGDSIPHTETLTFQAQ